MPKLIDITFHANDEYADTDQLRKAQRSSLLYAEAMPAEIDICMIKHIANPSTRIIDHPRFRFFRKQNGFFRMPWQAFRFIAQQKPDFILVQGFIFPLQVFILAKWYAPNAKILLMHHADRPVWGKRLLMQRVTDGYVHRYIFSSMGNAEAWIRASVIRDVKKIVLIPGTITDFNGLNRDLCRARLGWQAGIHFIWVGRLNGNKDPLTVATSFLCFAGKYERLWLHFLYRENDQLQQLQSLIQQYPEQASSVILHGQVPNDELPVWYSAADYYIHSSHAEAGSVALLEAMACGCIPVISAIPSSLTVTDNGKYAYCFSPGNTGSLMEQLEMIMQNKELIDAAAMKHWYEQEYALPAIIRKWSQVFCFDNKSISSVTESFM